MSHGKSGRWNWHPIINLFTPTHAGSGSICRQIRFDFCFFARLVLTVPLHFIRHFPTAVYRSSHHNFTKLSRLHTLQIINFIPLLLPRDTMRKCDVPISSSYFKGEIRRGPVEKVKGIVDDMVVYGFVNWYRWGARRDQMPSARGHLPLLSALQLLKGRYEVSRFIEISTY